MKKPKQHYIACWKSYFEHLIQIGNDLENVPSAMPLNVGDILVFYVWNDAKNVIIRTVNCKTIDDEYCLQCQRLHFRARDHKGNVKFNTHRIKPLYLGKKK